MKKNDFALIPLALLFSAFTLGFTKHDQPVVGYVEVNGFKSGKFNGNAGSPESDINITSFNYIAEDKQHKVLASVKFSKPLDETSGQFQNCLNTNEVLPTIRFTLFNMQGKKQIVYEIVKLTNAFIKQIDQNAPNETITLQFQKIETYYP